MGGLSGMGDMSTYSNCSWSLDDYIACLQHFVQVAGRNTPNGGGVPPFREDKEVCVLYFKAVGTLPKAQQQQ